MEETQKGQVTKSAADVYEEFYIPAIFQEWVERVSNAAKIEPGQHVLDIACGTGVLSRGIAERVQPDGSVIGLDLNEGMLDVAKRKSPEIEWHLGSAESLPFANESFDAVASQFGLMSFENPVASLNEMWRVTKPGGNLAVAVWDDLDHMPGYAAMASLLRRLFGDGVMESFEAPFVLGNMDTLNSLVTESDIQDTQINTVAGSIHFPSIDAWVYTDIKGWTLADALDDEQFEKLRTEASEELSRFVQNDGSVFFPSSAHIVTATKA